MLVTYSYFVIVSAIFSSIASAETSSDFLGWFKNAITVDVPTLELLEFGNKSYYVETILMANYYQATLFCNFHNMRLLTVTSQKENDFLEKGLYDLGVPNFHFWTSGTILPSGHWVWMSSGRPIVYTNWEENEPDGGSAKEVCLEMRILNHGLTWNDLNCSSSLYFICECSTQNRHFNMTSTLNVKNSTLKDMGSQLGEPPTA